MNGWAYPLLCAVLAAIAVACAVAGDMRRRTQDDDARARARRDAEFARRHPAPRSLR